MSGPFCAQCCAGEGRHYSDCETQSQAYVAGRKAGRDEARLAIMAFLSEIPHKGARNLSVALQNAILGLEKL
jgi:hypothetical protein